MRYSRLAIFVRAHQRLITAISACLIAILSLLYSPTVTGASTSTLRFRQVVLPGNSSILVLLQDRRGFVWIGTQGGGLVRYDGINSIKYINDAAKPASLPHNWVHALHEDSAGRLWVGTRAGLARYEPATDSFTRLIPPAGALNRQNIKAIISDRANGLWLATWGGIQHLNTVTGLFTEYVHDPLVKTSLAHNDVNALALDEHGGLWAATWPGGLDYLAAGGKKFRHFRIDRDNQAVAGANDARALRFDRHQTLWIGTGAGIVTWRRDTDWKERRLQPGPRFRVNQFFLDNTGTMWAGTISAGLLQFAPHASSPLIYHHRANDLFSLPADNVRAVMVDRAGMLWAGTFTDGLGLASLTTSGIHRLIPHDVHISGRQPSNILLALAHTEQGRIWLGGRNGLTLFDPIANKIVANFKKSELPNSLSSDVVYSLYQQPGGHLWVGTGDGLNRLDATTKQFKLFRFATKADGFINSISAGSSTTLWLGTGGAVIRFDTASGAWHAYRHDPSKPNSRSASGATTILEDRRGCVWIGSETGGGGLDLLDQKSGRIRNYSLREGSATGLASDIVTSLHQDPNGRIWVGTDKGLNEILTTPDGSVSFRQFGKASVGQLRIISILSGPHGRIWLSTPSGLIHLDPTSGSVTKFSDTDGVSDSFTVGSAAAHPSGVLYFGGMRGMTVVDPSRVRSISVAPQVAITDVTVVNRSLTLGRRASVQVVGPVMAPSSISLSAQEPIFSIEFAGLHFTDPASNKYQYRLEGFDDKWVEADASHRSATYTNLAPGDYRFRVRSFNNRGLVSANEASMSINIRPPYWQTWWFRVATSLLALACLVGAYFWRVAHFVKQHNELERQVAARTRDLEQVNNKLAALALTDGLTSVTNRRGFDAVLLREWARAARDNTELSVAMIDADSFKLFNDEYGHQAGDHCLRAIATVLQTKARRPADLVARYGGEEFAIIFPDTKLEHALAIAKSICLAVAERGLPHLRSAHGLATVSVGVASAFPAITGDSEGLIASADHGLYEAKARGRNQACSFDLLARQISIDTKSATSWPTS